jgi:RNA polymerase sigma-70 factor, ECF subfamily
MRQGDAESNPSSPENSPTVRRLDALARGEFAAADMLYRHVERRILAAVTAEMGRDLMARISPEDLKQEVLRRSLPRIHEFGPHQRNELWAWFHTLAKAVVIDEARKIHARKRAVQREVRMNQGEVQIDMAAGGSTVSRRVLRRELSAKIDAAMLQLSPSDREILDIQFRRRVRMTAHDLARELGCTPEAASMRLSRASARLREILREQGVIE